VRARGGGPPKKTERIVPLAPFPLRSALHAVRPPVDGSANARAEPWRLGPLGSGEPEKDMKGDPLADAHTEPWERAEVSERAEAGSKLEVLGPGAGIGDDMGAGGPHPPNSLASTRADSTSIFALQSCAALCRDRALQSCRRCWAARVHTPHFFQKAAPKKRCERLVWGSDQRIFFQ
jgi:hypothetical protein